MSRRESVFPAPTSPTITAMHSPPSSMAKSVSATALSTEAWASTYMEGSGYVIEGCFLQSPVFVIHAFSPPITIIGASVPPPSEAREAAPSNKAEALNYRDDPLSVPRLPPRCFHSPGTRPLIPSAARSAAQILDCILNRETPEPADLVAFQHTRPGELQHGAAADPQHFGQFSGVKQSRREGVRQVQVEDDRLCLVSVKLLKLSVRSDYPGLLRRELIESTPTGRGTSLTRGPAGSPKPPPYPSFLRLTIQIFSIALLSGYSG